MDDPTQKPTLTASQLAHADMPIRSPLGEAALDAGIARLALRPGDRVLDVGSGGGELLRRVVLRFPGVTGIGVDLLATAPVHPDVELRQADAATVASERFDAVCCVGSLHALGGFPDAYQRLRRLAPQSLIGDAYWRRDPDPVYLERLGATADELPDGWEGLVTGVTAAGLAVRWSAQASVADLAAYELALLANAARHPDRADVVAYADAIRAWRAAPGGTDTLGFALMHCVAEG